MKKIIEFFESNGGYARMKELKEAKFNSLDVKKLVEDGIVEKIKPGLYRLSDIKDPSNIGITFVDVAKAIPQGVICLISALNYYELTTFTPSEIYVAIPNNKQIPDIYYPPVKAFYFRKRIYEPGIETIKTEYGDVKIYDREKSICDIFRYRNKLGEDIAFESLKNYIRSKKTNFFKLQQYAEQTKVKTVLLPYLKALLG